MLAALQVSLAALAGPLADTAPVAPPPVVREAPSLAPTIEAIAPATFQDARFDPGIQAAFADTTRKRSIEYSDGYYVRLKIHQYASWAMLPFFIGSYATGSDLINNGNNASSFSKDWHGVFAGATAALFAVNTVTGVWNLVESRHDPAGRTRRWVHAIAMFVAEAGFVATGATAPEIEDGGEVGEGGDASTHKALAITSMSIATASWLMMLIWKD
jgi:hypothetical protein